MSHQPLRDQAFRKGMKSVARIAWRSHTSSPRNVLLIVLGGPPPHLCYDNTGRRAGPVPDWPDTFFCHNIVSSFRCPAYW